MRSTSGNQVLEAVWDVVTRRTFERAQAATELCVRLLTSRGAVSRREDELVVGDTVLNHDRDFLPKMSQASGLGFCVYLGNRRIATATVLDAGTSPDVGGFAPPQVVDAVLRRRDTFQGRIPRDDREYLIVARPLFASDAPDLAPVGMIEAFQDEQSFLDLMSSAARASFQQESDSVRERADNMESIIHFIDDVARKLQLLALNGNIIAAQAGEHGRAFRVVCRELGSLADEAKLMATDVGKMVQRMGLDLDDEGEFEDELAPIEPDELVTEAPPE